MLRRVVILLFVFVFLMPSYAYALRAGFDGISDYSHWWYPNCKFGDRAGAQYVDNLYNAISSRFNLGFKYTDYDANESHLRTDSIVNSVHFYAFSGHERYYHQYYQTQRESGDTIANVVIPHNGQKIP